MSFSFICSIYSDELLWTLYLIFCRWALLDTNSISSLKANMDFVNWRKEQRSNKLQSLRQMPSKMQRKSKRLVRLTKQKPLRPRQESLVSKSKPPKALVITTLTKWPLGGKSLIQLLKFLRSTVGSKLTLLSLNSNKFSLVNTEKTPNLSTIWRTKVAKSAVWDTISLFPSPGSWPTTPISRK